MDQLSKVSYVLFKIEAGRRPVAESSNGRIASRDNVVTRISSIDAALIKATYFLPSTAATNLERFTMSQY